MDKYATVQICWSDTYVGNEEKITKCCILSKSLQFMMDRLCSLEIVDLVSELSYWRQPWGLALQ